MNTAHKSSQRGFTLIELLIVMAIIAILATVGFITYSNVQSKARDSKRIQEISTLAKSIESSKDPVKATYTYDSTKATNDFPNASATTAPYQDSYGNVYCVLTKVSTDSSPYTPPANASATWTGTSCPGSYADTNTAITSVDASGNPIGVLDKGTATSWTVCTSLENNVNGSKIFCKSSATH